MNQILGRLSWLEKTGMDGLLPEALAKRVLPPSHTHGRVDAVKYAMAKMRTSVEDEWDRGMELYERAHTESEKGVDALWMCSRSGWAQWKISTNYIEKGMMFLFANGLAASLVAPVSSQSICCPLRFGFHKLLICGCL